MILKCCDFQMVSDKIRAVPEADMSLSITFGQVAANPQELVMETLQSYLASRSKRVSRFPWAPRGYGKVRAQKLATYERSIPNFILSPMRFSEPPSLLFSC
ncbi:hypothetical protein D9M70_258750 [compost metagenome]